MQKVLDSTYWSSAFLDCPFSPSIYEMEKVVDPRGHPDDCLHIPGIHVKACLEDSGWKYTGKLVKYGGPPLKWRGTSKPEVTEEVVVLSTQDKETVWFGTIEQYEQMWCVD